MPIGFEHALATLLGLPVLVTFVAAAALFAWARHVTERHPTRALWKRAQWIPVVSSILAGSGIVAAIAVWTHYRVHEAGAAPGERAERLAAAMSESMNGAALFIAAAWVLLVASAIASLIGTLRRVR